MHQNYPRNSKIASKSRQEVGQAVLDPNTILTALIHNLKIAWPTKISKSFWSSFNNPYKMHILFFKKVLITQTIITAHHLFRSLCEIRGDCFGKSFFFFFFEGALSKEKYQGQNNHQQMYTMTKIQMVQSYYYH